MSCRYLIYHRKPYVGQAYNGKVNRHYAHYYRQENLKWIKETHFQNVFHVNVWCSIIKVGTVILTFPEIFHLLL
jgi:hypothetical protein